MPYLWLVVVALVITWMTIWSMKKRIEELALAAPLSYVYKYEIYFTKRVISDVLNLTPEELEHLKPAIENPIHLTIEFWRGHLVIFLEAEGKQEKPWPVYLPSSDYVKSPLTIWEKRFASGKDNEFDLDPPIPALRLSLTADALQMAAINGRFGRAEDLKAKPEHVFMKLPFSRAELADYYDDDPDAVHYQPRNVSEYKNHDKEELMFWYLTIFDLDASDRYLT